MTEKEKGAIPFESAPQAANNAQDSTAPEMARAPFHPLTWCPEKPTRFRGKGKRRTRADAIARKRGEYGRIAPDLAAWLAVLVVVLLMVGGTR